MSFFSSEELKQMGFACVGKNVNISRKCSVYNASKISIASNVRIDDFCILSAGSEGISIGRNVHIACYVSIIGSAEIKIGDFVGISSKTTIYSSSDDYSGNFLTGPTIPENLKNVDSRPVRLEDHVIIGAQCVILPGVTLGEGCAVGSFTLVSKNLDAWQIFAGNPIRSLKPRSKEMLRLLSQLEDLN